MEMGGYPVGGLDHCISVDANQKEKRTRNTPLFGGCLSVILLTHFDSWRECHSVI